MKIKIQSITPEDINGLFPELTIKKCNLILKNNQQYIIDCVDSKIHDILISVVREELEKEQTDE